MRDASERVRALEWERDRLRGELGEFYAREAQLEVAVREAETEVRRREAHLENLLQKATDSLNELQAEVSQKGAELEAQRLHAQGAGVAAEKLEAQVQAARALEEKIRREELRAANLEKMLEETKEELEEARQWRDKAESHIETQGEQRLQIEQLAEQLAGCRAQTLDLKGQLREKTGALNAAQALEKKAHAREKAALKKVGDLEDKLAAALAAATQQPSNFLPGGGAAGGVELDAELAAAVPDATFEPEDAALPEVEDLAKLTAAELKKRLKAVGIACPAKAKKADLLNLLVGGAAGSAGAEGGDGGEEAAGPEPEASAGAAAAEEPLAGEDLGKLTAAEVKKRLEAAGISYPAKAKKAALVELLRGGSGDGATEASDAPAKPSARKKRSARPSSANAAEKAKRTRTSTRKG